MPSPKPNSWTLWAITIITCFALASLVAVTVTLASSISFADRPTYPLALSASFADIVALVASVGLVWLHQRRLLPRLLLPFALLSAAVNIAAALLTIYVLTWIWGSLFLADEKNRTLTAAGFAIWSITVLSASILHILVLCSRSPQAPAPQTPRQTMRSSKLIKRSLNSSRPSTPFATPLSPPRHSEPVSSAFSAYSDSIRYSFRHSVSKAIRPVTSRTKLLFHHPLLSHDSSSIISSPTPGSTDLRRESDGFENWDLPASTPSSRENRFLKKYSHAQENCRLETIPGSRPPSPGNALDTLLPEKTSPPRHAESPDASPTFPCAALSPAPRRDSSSGGGGGNQSHIHPLFRSASPAPRPLTSPGTVITASPYAGQVVSPDHSVFAGLRRTDSDRSGSRPGSPLSCSPEGSLQGRRWGNEFERGLC